MKKIITLTLCAALILAPIERARSSAVLAVCLIGAAVIAGATIIFTVKTCKPKYYCMKDSDGNYFSSNATKKDRIVNDWVIISGPYSSAESAAANCHKPAATGLVMMAALESGDQVYIPEVPIKIWKSHNLVSWVLRDTIIDDPSNFSWSETNAISDHFQMFYRASY